MSNADVLDTRFRSALRRMLEAGRLRAYEGEADPKLEIAAVMKKFDGEDAAILFGDVAGHDVPVVGNVLSNKLNCEAAFGCDFRAIRTFVGRAIGGPLPPVLVERAPAHEEVHRNGFDIGAMLPVLTHTPDDAGRFITAGVVVTRDPETGVYNASYHRLQLLGAQRAAIRLDYGRHLRLAWERAKAKGEHLPIAVCIGADIALQYTAATMGSQMPENADELAVAGGLERAAASRRQGGEPGPAGAGGHRDRARRRDPLRRDRARRAVRRVRRLSRPGRGDADRRGDRAHPPAAPGLSRDQRLRPRDHHAAQIRAGGEPPQGAAAPRCPASSTPR